MSWSFEPWPCTCKKCCPVQIWSSGHATCSASICRMCVNFLCSTPNEKVVLKIPSANYIFDWECKKNLFWFFKALIKNGVQRFLLTYASRIYKLLYSLRIWNFFSSTKAKTQEMKFCNNSNTLFALLLNSLLLQFTLQQLKNTLCTTFELTKGQ